MIRAVTRRTLASVLGLAIVGSQAGHVLAYALRFGDTAQTIQSSGVHAYFPMLAKTAVGCAAMALIAGIFIIGFARVATGRRIEKQSVPSFIRLLATLYTMQLTLFAGQETAEALISRGPAGSVAVLLLWGTVGQLPVAVVGAIALRWLLARMRPALARLESRLGRAFQLLPHSVVMVLLSVATPMVPALEGVANPTKPRGPPFSS